MYCCSVWYLRLHRCPSQKFGGQHCLPFPVLMSKPCCLCLLSAQQNDFLSYTFVVSSWVQPLITLLHAPLLSFPASLLASPVVQFLKQTRLCHCPQCVLVTSLCLALRLPGFHFSTPPSLAFGQPPYFEAGVGYCIFPGAVFIGVTVPAS